MKAVISDKWLVVSRREALKAVLALPVFAARVEAKAQAGMPAPPRPEKKRPCDGACCHESPLRRPRFGTRDSEFADPEPRNPNAECRFCEFHDHAMQFDVNSGCRIMADPKLLNELTEEELRRFAEGCVGYPYPYAPTAGYGRCCYGEN